MILKILSGILAILLIGVSSLGAQEWYRSAPNGIPGNSLYSGPSASGWSLVVERSGEEETRSLFNNGDLQATTISIRSEGRLVIREERDAVGELLTRVEYAYDAHGNPRAIFIGMEDKSDRPSRIATQQNISADSLDYSTADGSDGDWHITDYDESRNKVNQTILESGAILAQITWKRDSEGDLREEIRTQGSDVTRSLFDTDGRLQEETVTRNGAVILLRSYRWSGVNLIRVEERGEGRLVVREMTWNGNLLQSEIRSIDGVVMSETLWSSSRDRTEVLYRDGEAIIRVIWAGDSKIREEFLKGGEVIRIQEAGR